MFYQIFGYLFGLFMALHYYLFFIFMPALLNKILEQILKTEEK
jgi:hypothetical protein